MSNLTQTIEHLKSIFINYQTETLVFRPFVKSDCFPLYVASQIPGFNDKLCWGPPINQEELMIEVLKLIREHDLNQSVVISVCEKNNGKWAGLVKFSIHEDSITMSLWLHPDYWNTRTPIRCAESALEIVFSNTDLSHIYAIILKNYPTMEKMVKYNGFKHVDEHIFMHEKGHPLERNTFKLSKNDWSRKTRVTPY